MSKFIGALAVAVCVACSSSQDDKKDAAPPSGAYVKVYAMAFVEAMRTAGVEAGAFDISKRPEEDGMYHLGIDVMRDGKSERMEVLLRPEAGGFLVERATLGGAAVTGEIGAGLDDWHASAAEAAASE